MAVAYWMFHAPQSTFPIQNGGDAAILYCFVFLLIAAAGPGPWSVDSSLGRKRTVIRDEGATAELP
jgi:putative oxidoreductase